MTMGIAPIKVLHYYYYSRGRSEPALAMAMVMETEGNGRGANNSFGEGGREEGRETDEGEERRRADAEPGRDHWLSSLATPPSPPPLRATARRTGGRLDRGKPRPPLGPSAHALAPPLVGEGIRRWVGTCACSWICTFLRLPRRRQRLY